ncbi:hypothetical protein CRH03_14205 [Clostridium sp. HMb25]|nr:hypothetical protein CRH03_14205 [Clostridium sp. HMb25]
MSNTAKAFRIKGAFKTGKSFILNDKKLPFNNPPGRCTIFARKLLRLRGKNRHRIRHKEKMYDVSYKTGK